MTRQTTRTFLLLLSLLFSLPGFGQWYSNYDNGKAAIRDDKWQLAIDELSRAIREKPEARNNAKTHGLNFIDYCPYLYRSVAYFHVNRLEDARRDLQNSDRFGAVKNAKRDRDVADFYRRYEPRIRDTGSDKLQEFLKNGMAAFERGDYATAKKHFNSALSLDGNNNTARQYLQRIDDQQAGAAVEKIVAEGRRSMQSGDYASALSSFRQAQQQDAQFAGLDDLIAEANAQLRQQREFQSAVDVYNNQDYVRARGLFAALQQQAGGNSAAADYIRQIDSKLLELAQQESRKDPPADRPAVAKNEPETRRTDKPADPPKRQTETAKPVVTNTTPGQSGKDKSGMSESLRRAILVYYHGDYHQAIASLRQMHEGEELPANVILGSAYASQYYLGGSVKSELLEKARACFAKVRHLDANYSLEGKHLSPRILALFKETR